MDSVILALALVFKGFKWGFSYISFKIFFWNDFIMAFAHEFREAPNGGPVAL